MKVVGVIALLLSSLCGYAQQEILNKEWVVKRVSNNALLLSVKSADEISIYLKKPCEFQDTSYYWTFTATNTLDITEVIRSCTKGGKNPILDADTIIHSATKIDTLHKPPALDLSNGKTFTAYEPLDIDMKEFRLSLYGSVQGKYDLKKKRITIRETTKFDGNYRIKIIDSGSIRLILKRK